MNQVQDITDSISSFQPSLANFAHQNLNKRTVRTGHVQPGANFHQHHYQEAKADGEKTLQGLTTVPSEPSETAPPLPRDQAAWLPVAQQILAGEFDGADGSTLESLAIALRGIRHPVCESAIKHLWPPDGLLPKHLQPR